MRIYIKNGAKYYRAEVTPAWARKHDNGALISCGLTVGENGITARMVDRMVTRGDAREVTHDEWNHSGCQSSCVQRGAASCRW